MSGPAETRRALIALSHDLGAEHRGLAILGEGNASARLSNETFIVKASGSSLGTLTEADVTECRFAPLLAMLDRDDLSDKEVDDELFACRVDPSAKKPSVEALFHAYLLSLPEISFVGHTHPLHINQILCSPRAREFAAKKLFPDDIVCCGPASRIHPLHRSRLAALPNHPSRNDAVHRGLGHSTARDPARKPRHHYPRTLARRREGCNADGGKGSEDLHRRRSSRRAAIPVRRKRQPHRRPTR